MTPYGYMKNPKDKYSIIVDEVAAPIVKEVFDLYLDGLSTKNIAKILNEKGYITPSDRKKQLMNVDFSHTILEYMDKKSSWTNGAVISILMNENYTGTYVFNVQPKLEIGGTKARILPKEECERVPNHHEAIVSYEVFNKVSELKSKNSFISKNTDYEWYKKSPLQSFVRCKQCGHILNCQITKKRRKDGTINELVYFRCRICPQRGEPLNNVRADKIEHTVFKLLKDKFNIESNETFKKEEEEKLIINEIKKLENKKDLAYEKYKLGKISREKFIVEKQRFESELSILKDKLERISNKVSEKSQIDKLTREVVEQYIESIYVYEKEIVEVNYKN